MPHSTRLVACLVHAEPPLDEQAASSRTAGADLIELRVDRIGDVAAIERFLRSSERGPVILTIRSASEGGAWDDDDGTRVALLERLGLHLPGYIDVEWAAWERSANLRQKVELVARRDVAAAATPLDRPRNQLILSLHELRATPQNLGDVAAPLLASPAHIAKLAFHTRDAADALRLLELLRDATRRRPTAVLGLGDAGVATRVLAPKFGAALVYAAAAAEAPAAPGQPTLAELVQVYRWRDVGPPTRVFGIIGWPVAHSLSPRLHNAAMAAAGIDGVYVPFPVGPEYDDFRRFMDLVDASPWLDLCGLSVTAPHKTHALRWLRERGCGASPVAQRCDAVNTLVRTNRQSPAAEGGCATEGCGSWRGENSDAAGALAALQSVPELAGEGLCGRRVDVLGAGGAARALVALLCDLGCEVTVYNRSPRRGQELARDIGCTARDWDARRQASAELLINCTSVGMAPRTDDSPMPRDGLRARWVFDTVYAPVHTRLLRDAQACGATIITGDRMLIAQAQQQFIWWHGAAPPAGVMERAFGRVAL